MKKIWKLRKNAEAVSPVIATILMVAITVVLAAVLGWLVLVRLDLQWMQLIFSNQLFLEGNCKLLVQRPWMKVIIRASSDIALTYWYRWLDSSSSLPYTFFSRPRFAWCFITISAIAP